MPRTARMAANETRESLIAEALALLAESGWGTLSMRALAGRVGISAPSIHYHFATKDDLGLAMIAHLNEQRIEHGQGLEATYPKAEERLRALGRHVAEDTDFGEHGCPFYALQAQYSTFAPPLQEAITALVHSAIAQISRWFEEGRDQGALSFPGDSEDLAWMAWSLLQQGTQLQLIRGDRSLARGFDRFIDTCSQRIPS